MWELDVNLSMGPLRAEPDCSHVCLCCCCRQLEASYRRLRHSFAWQQQLGWLSSSPADVGTGLRVQVSLRLKLLPEHRRAEDVIARLRLHMEKTGD